MTTRIQKLTFWFYIWFFTSLSYLSNLGLSLNESSLVIISQLILFLIFSSIGLVVLSKRQKEIKNLKKVNSFQILYQREIMTACIIALSCVVDIFLSTNISKLIYILTVFYHLYWFIKNYPLKIIKS